jgi:hypothetical protein
MALVGEVILFLNVAATYLKNKMEGTNGEEYEIEEPLEIHLTHMLQISFLG